MDFFAGLLYGPVSIMDPREIRTGHLAKTLVETVKFLVFETLNSLKFVQILMIRATECSSVQGHVTRDTCAETRLYE